MASRILVVSNHFPPYSIGGAEIVAFRQARALSERDHEVVIFAGAEQSQQMPPGTLTFDMHEGLPVYRLALRSLGPDLNFFWASAARRLRAMIASHNIDVVHFHNLMGLGANLIPAAKSMVRKCIVTLHDHWGFCFQQTRLRPDGSICSNHEECAGCKQHIRPDANVALPMRLRRDYVIWCLSQADQLLVPSGYLAYAYSQAGFPTKALRVVSNGIDLDSVSAEPKLLSQRNAVRFLWSGYLGEHKGVPILLEAIEKLSGDTELFGRWEVTIAGDGHLRSKVEGSLRSGKFANVEFLGRVPRVELLQRLRSIDVCVLTSIWPENEPVTMLEAIASGSAQIATRIGGNVGLVEHNKSGFLIAPNDSTELAQTMRRYILDPKLAAQHGARNFERRAEYDEKRTIETLQDILFSAASSVPEDAREPVVICGTAWPAVEVAMLMNRVHDHLMPGLTPRFVWRDWARWGAWNDAKLVWLWDRHPAEPLVNEALRRGVSVLAPTSDWAVGLARHYDGVILYQTYLEALAALRAILSMESLQKEFTWRARAGAAAATAMAPNEAFSLQSETAF